MDRYEDARSIPLIDVLAHFGHRTWKKRKSGREHYGACPLHKPEKNKTSFSFTQEKWHCFACGLGGSGSIDLCIKLANVGFKQAVEILSKIQPSTKSVESHAEAPTPGENSLFKGVYEKHYVKSDWLENRGISQEALNRYGVGQYFNPSRQSVYANKILFPILRFSDGGKVGYLAREILDQNAPKYVFPSGFHKSLEVFGAWQSKQSLSGQVRHRLGFVVESPLCVMAFRQHGFEAVSPFGWPLSASQIEIVASLFVGVVYLPDRNKYGECASTVHALSQRVWLKCPALPSHIDDPERLDRDGIVQLLKSVYSQTP